MHPSTSGPPLVLPNRTPWSNRALQGFRLVFVPGGVVVRRKRGRDEYIYIYIYVYINMIIHAYIIWYINVYANANAWVVSTKYIVCELSYWRCWMGVCFCHVWFLGLPKLSRQTTGPNGSCLVTEKVQNVPSTCRFAADKVPDFIGVSIAWLVVKLSLPIGALIKNNIKSTCNFCTEKHWLRRKSYQNHSIRTVGFNTTRILGKIPPPFR